MSIEVSRLRREFPLDTVWCRIHASRIHGEAFVCSVDFLFCFLVRCSFLVWILRNDNFRTCGYCQLLCWPSRKCMRILSIDLEAFKDILIRLMWQLISSFTFAAFYVIGLCIIPAFTFRMWNSSVNKWWAYQLLACALTWGAPKDSSKDLLMKNECKPHLVLPTYTYSRVSYNVSAH